MKTPLDKTVVIMAILLIVAGLFILGQWFFIKMNCCV